MPDEAIVKPQYPQFACKAKNLWYSQYILMNVQSFTTKPLTVAMPIIGLCDFTRVIPCANDRSIYSV